MDSFKFHYLTFVTFTSYYFHLSEDQNHYKFTEEAVNIFSGMAHKTFLCMNKGDGGRGWGWEGDSGRRGVDLASLSDILTF